MANTHMNRRGSQMNSACYRMAPLAAAVIMILLYTSTFCMASISLAMKINNNQPTETLTTSTTNDNSLSSTTTSITTSATTTTITNLKQLFPGLWSYLPGKNSSNVAIGDTNGFSFALTERTGEKKTYKGLLQIHASPKPQWLVIDVNSKEISYQFRATPTISTLRVDVRQNRFCFTLNFIPKNSTLLAKVSQFASALLAGEQKVYNFASSTTKYDAAINSLCTTANGVSRVDAFLIADEAVVSCAKKPAKQQNNSPNIFITRSLIIKVGLPMGKGKFIQPSKRCLSLDKFDSRLADTLGNRYFAEMLSDSLDNKVALEKGVSRPTFWFESRSDSCTLAYMADSAKCASYLSSSSAKPTKTCIFIHGAGGPYDQAPKYDSYASYWGDVENWTPQCKKRVFAVRNTKTIGWDDVNLQKYYCDLAVKESGINSTVRGIPQLKNVIIFTHSQGGLVMSAALNNKKCALDSTSSWYSISTPFQGSEMVDRLVTYCAAYKNPTNLLSKDYYYGYLATEYGYCDPATGKPYPGYMSLSKNYSKGGIKTTQLYTATTISRSYKPAGRMCGTSPIGILSRYSLILTALAETTDISNPNDGLLENSSCSSISTGTFTSLQTSAFYSGNVNHADTSCRNGNGWFSRSKQPCLYYKDKI